jgi:hypothetical protein
MCMCVVCVVCVYTHTIYTYKCIYTYTYTHTHTHTHTHIPPLSPSLLGSLEDSPFQQRFSRRALCGESVLRGAQGGGGAGGEERGRGALENQMRALTPWILPLFCLDPPKKRGRILPNKILLSLILSLSLSLSLSLTHTEMSKAHFFSTKKHTQQT